MVRLYFDVRRDFLDDPTAMERRWLGGLMVAAYKRGDIAAGDELSRERTRLARLAGELWDAKLRERSATGGPNSAGGHMAGGRRERGSGVGPRQFAGRRRP